MSRIRVVSDIMLEPGNVNYGDSQSKLQVPDGVGPPVGDEEEKHAPHTRDV